MKMTIIKRMRDRAPFRPFHIHLTTGEILPVNHPENMAVPEDKTEMFVVWVGSDWNLVDADQVARVSVRTKAAK